ncbi:hypothetical protein C1752_00498 [Acaryochloris thomasi RCC1774]|uniref:Band 7 domain-containing protein n=1 Tax=Acaryochloris thomasi RCC1774 TaxID=1764569 RepID=A0A2W1K5U7_9CYAN|nr:slipin family protein [Acaryochloris thomasi]PZD75057.1 hypothetical protein C1752_00498 [Acaryochloris thomasi RCC1774]
MFKSFYIKPHERGMLFYRSNFQQVLQPGIHRRIGWHWNVRTFDLNQPEAQLENLELLLQSHADQLNEHFTVVRTTFSSAALVRLGQRWCTVGPDQLRVFWRGFIEVEVHFFNLDEDFELPTAFVQQLREQVLPGLTLVQISESQVGMLYERDNFVRPLESGEYGFWTFNRKVQIPVFDCTHPAPSFPNEEVLFEQHPEFVATYCEAVQLGGQEVAIARHKNKVIAVLPPCSRKLFWKGVTVEVIDISSNAKLPAALVAELISGLPEVLDLAYGSLHVLEVPSQHLGLLYNEGAFQEPLAPGYHGWWIYGRSLTTEVIDLRLQTLEVSGQEILSKDKVPLRLNLTAGYRIEDPVKAKTGLADIEGFVYKELQFALRGAVGTKTLDALLEDKGAIDNSVAEHMLPKVEEYGINLESVGVKDIILPGEIKAILCQVVEAEKSAQANVIRRREETAATRSMLNTAKVMENNPVALRLKELELLERIADKIEKINVNGSLDSILTDIIQIERQ